MTTSTTDSVLVNGWRVAHGIFGSGEPVVLIHGTPSSSYIWRNVVPALVEAGLRVHLFDLLGFGASERPWDPSVDTSILAQTDVLKELLEVWGLGAAHIVAHDIGGGVAMRLAVLDRERLRSLTLIDSVSFDSWPSQRTRQQMQAGLDALIKAPDSDHRAHFGDWLLSTVVAKETFSTEALAPYLEIISGPVGQASLFQHQVRHYDPKYTMDIAGRLSELRGLPTQILWGENDAWQVVDWAHRLHDAIPDSTLHLMPDCGHFAMEDQPELVAQHIIRFVGDA